MVVTSDRHFTRLNYKDFDQILDKTHTAIKQKSGAIRILSFSFAIAPLDPLEAIQALTRRAHPSPDHFYWERGGDGVALAAAGYTAKVYFQGEQRFHQGRFFADRCLAQTVLIGDVHLPFGGPHLFCSFSFFPESGSPAPGGSVPFAPATLLLPRWHLARHHQQSVLVVNCLWSAGQSLEALCRSVWQTLDGLQQPGVCWEPLLAQGGAGPDLGDGALPWTGELGDLWVPPAASGGGAAPVGAGAGAGGVRGGNLRPGGEPQQFKRAVEASLGAIAAGELGKVVLAHTLEVTSGQPFQVGSALENLRRLHPDCYLFSVGNGQGSTFLGASPERLLCVDQGDLYTEALAGSAPRGRSALEDEQLARSLLSSPKELHEHQLVVDFILQQLHQLGLHPHPSPAPSLRQLSNIQHLLTPIHASVSSPVHPLEIIAHLHPTPAVAGVPRGAACDHIRQWEPFERSLYAAPLGWLDYRGNCEFIVGIRSALLQGNRALLFAGAGIVSGSDPDRELIEVELKFQTLLSALC